MFNNFLIKWFLFIITIKLVLFLYKISKLYFNKLDIFTFDIETLVLLNGKTIHYIRFRNVNSVPNWPDNYFKLMLNVVLQHLDVAYSSNLSNNIHISITFFTYDSNTDLHKVISNPCIINYTESLGNSENVFYNLITFHNKNQSDDNNDIVVIIKEL